MSDLISRKAAIDAVRHSPIIEVQPAYMLIDKGDVLKNLVMIPSAQPEWNNHEVACLLAELFDDDCACNFNGIDEWLPLKCDFAETCCPYPVGVACWEQYLKHRAERRTNE